MINFDGPNLLITLSPGQTNITTEEIYGRWKDWVQLADNAKFLQAFRIVGGDPLTTGINAGSYIFLQNQYGWRIKPPEENINIFIGGNLVAEDPTQDVLVPTDGYYTTAIFGLQPITQRVDELLALQNVAIYNGSVHINTLTGSPGVQYPVGTASVPVNNWTDAQLIANNFGFRKFKLLGSIVLNQPAPFSVFEGVGGLAEIDLNGQYIDASSFTKISLSGSMHPGMSNAPLALECKISNGLSNLHCNGNNVLIEGGVTTGSKDIIVGNIGNSNGIAEINCTQLTENLILRSVYGRFRLTNLVEASANVFVDADSIHLTVDSSCTAGLIRVRGLGIFIDMSTGTTVDSSGFLHVPFFTDAANDIRGSIISSIYDVQFGSTSSVIITSSVKSANFYNNLIVAISSEVSGTVARSVTGFSSGEFTLDSALPFVPGLGDKIVVLNRVASAAASVDTEAVASAIWGTSPNINISEQSMLAKIRRNLPR